MLAERTYKRDQARHPFPIQRRLQTDYGSGIRFYDDELDMPSSVEHTRSAIHLGNCLRVVADDQKLLWLSDNSVLYWDSEKRQEKPIFGDIVLADSSEDPRKTIAYDLLLVLEVVSTGNLKSEHKDTIDRKRLNEKHCVPEFILYFPKLTDDRSLEWYVYDFKIHQYRRLQPTSDGFLHSHSVIGLDMRVLPRSQWAEDSKVEVFLHGQKLDTYTNTVRKSLRSQTQAKLAKQRVVAEKKRADVEKQRADQEKQRADQAERRIQELERRR